ncbi:fasciclin domain-containing protein [Rhizosphaericola mali]|uniref:fasciclin domain-containing protein n=1 Tax=Rhizosphaericola mali TaxID=2545455 RepID=UPI00177E52EA|nr:fasciclin domain-containing protein [Rhizosphaericola mali]
MEKTNTDGYLNAYGTYTFFAPTNDAINLWLKDSSYSTIDQVPVNTLNDFVKIHLVKDTLSSSDFTDGKLPSITLYGQYLITDVTLQSGKAYYRINRRALVTSVDNRLGNGLVHEIDHVIVPEKNNLADRLKNDPRYSIFYASLISTGLIDSLNFYHSQDTTRDWVTVLAESDSVYNSLGITSYDQLYKKYSNTGNPKLYYDSLHMYIGYHLIPGLRYLADIVTSTSLPTYTSSEVVTVKTDGQTVLLNEDEFNGNIEPGIGISRNYSDVLAENGTIHDLQGDLYIKIRQPTAVYFDVADQPELRKIVALFRKQGKSQEFTDPTQFSGINWNGGSITYTCAPSSSADYFVYNDYFAIELRSSVVQWVEFTTPFIVKGKYKVWVCYRRGGRNQTTQTLVDSVSLPKLFDYGEYYPAGLAEDVAEAQGYKRYMSYPYTATTNTSKLVGTVDITTSSTHKVRFVAISNTTGGAANRFNVDMVQFIPADQDQQWPRFNKDGSVYYK